MTDAPTDAALRAVWDDAVARVGTPLPQVVPTLRRYCDLRVLYDNALRIARASAVTAGLKANPAYAQVSSLSTALLALEQQLGLCQPHGRKAQVPR